MLTLLATLNALNPLLEMLKHNLMLIHASLHTLKSLLQMLKLRGEANLILIHAIDPSWSRIEYHLLLQAPPCKC